MPRVDDRWPDLGLPHEGSISVGAVAAGRLYQGTELPLAGDYHVVMHEHTGRATNFGTGELVQLVLNTARVVAEEFPGAVTTVGNLSRRGGGRLPWSISHQAGRDVDIAFFLKGEQDEQVVLSNMVPLLAPDGAALLPSGETVQFDVARNWALLRHLLTQDEVTVQYIFVADHLLDRMFQLASKDGFSAAQIRAWREFVRQPRGTLPHDDHFHIRILCAADDVAEGCRDIFGGREQVPRNHAGFQARTEDLMEIAADSKRPDADRSAALGRLAMMRAPGATRLGYRLLDGHHPAPVEAAALELLVELEARPEAQVLREFLLRTDDPAAAYFALTLLRQTSGRYARKLLPLLERDVVLVAPEYFWERQVDLLAESIRLFGWVGDLSAGKEVALFLAHDRRAVRAAALWSLRAMAAAEVFVDQAVDAPMDQPAKAWKSYVRKHRNTQRNFFETLKSRNYRVERRLGWKSAKALLSALRDDDYVSLNAQRALHRLTGRNVPLQLKDKGHVRWLWKKMVQRAKR